MKLQLDDLGHEILQASKEKQIMMQWEKPYMKALVDTLSPKGDVLEIGFGLGYSANYIAKYPIKSYTVIEADLEVFDEAKKWASKQKFETKIVFGYWQEELKKLDKFDSFFFDDYPSEKYPDDLQIRLYDFYYRILKNHAKKGSRFVWYSQTEILWICYPKTSWSCKKIEITPSKNCIYKKTNDLYLPLVTFDEGCLENIFPFAITQNFHLAYLEYLSYEQKTARGILKRLWAAIIRLFRPQSVIRFFR